MPDVPATTPGAKPGRPVEHGLRHTREYRAWAYVRRRAAAARDGAHEPGGLPPHLHDPHWGEFRGFLEDMGACPEGHALRRHDTDHGFDAKNCAWLPPRRKEG